jgi:GntR family transcriptional regulator, transcriptional repressor for pyruvate dehydrogenase complex
MVIPLTEAMFEAMFAVNNRVSSMSIRIGTISVPKSSDLLAERLRVQILAGGLAPGDSLPAERDLVADTGLSRGSVREALRILEGEGLVQTRPGRYGGSVVCQPVERLLARHVSVFAKGRRVSIQSLIEAREALEPMLAQLAAVNRTAQDLVSLEAISARLEDAAPTDVPRFLAENVAWHRALAIASHNELLCAFLTSISGLIHEASQMEDFAPDDVRALVVKVHRRILAAIAAGDADAARRRMERHVKAYSAQVLMAVQDAQRRRPS